MERNKVNEGKRFTGLRPQGYDGSTEKSFAIGGCGMKTIDFLGMETSRLIVGGNPFSGYAYSDDPDADREMMLYYDTKTIADTLSYAQSLGYTSAVMLADELAFRSFLKHRDGGGTMNYIAQVGPHYPPEVVKRHGADAMFVWGGWADGLIAEGNKTELIRIIQQMRRTGVPVGMASHDPDNLRMAEREGWGLDFYMVCLHRKLEGHVSSALTGLKGIDLEWVPGTREKALDFMRSCPKPCIAYKVFAGGWYARQGDGLLYEKLKEVYTSIKENDIAVIGFFQKHKDQLLENARLVSRILGESKA